MTDGALTFEFDVFEEFERLKPVGWPEFDALRTRGVPVRALVEPDLPACAAVEFVGGTDYFEIVDADSEGSVRALIFLALDELGDPVDLIAWSRKRKQCAAYLGRAWLLGLENLYAPRIIDGGTLEVCADPLAWLRGGRRGVVIVSPQRAAPLLRDAAEGEGLIVNSEAERRALMAILHRQSPRVIVRAQELARAS
jgi:hypothetical protein